MAATDALHDTQAVIQPVAKTLDKTIDKNLDTTSMADMPDCVYCPPAPDSDSDSGASIHRCLFPDESRVDSGNTQQARLDQLVAHPVFISVDAFSFVLQPVAALPLSRYLLPPVSARSLNLTHCKQLK